MNLYALHGFLGTPQDWGILSSRNCFRDKVEAVNLLAYPIDSLESWAEHFTADVRKQSAETSNVLLGYSLGGRLALHCLLQDPSLWKAAIIVSAHCGLDSEEKKRERCLHDEKWACLFETLAWDELMQRWNAQEIFKSSTLNREEEQFSRADLAKILRSLSLGKQQDLLPLIQSLSLPLLWITGENDTRFSQLAKTVHLKDPLSKMCAVPGAAHRVPWEQTESFIRIVERFLEETGVVFKVIANKVTRSPRPGF